MAVQFDEIFFNVEQILNSPHLLSEMLAYHDSSEEKTLRKEKIWQEDRLVWGLLGSLRFSPGKDVAHVQSCIGEPREVEQSGVL